MKTILAVLAVGAGGALMYAGYERQHSLAGRAESGAAELGTKIDGEPRVADHVWYYTGGGALVLGGLLGLGRRRG